MHGAFRQAASDGPVSGVGIGLRAPHLAELTRGDVDIAWLELLADNHLSAGGNAARALDAVCERYPTTLHAVNMNLGGIDPLDWEYLRGLRALKDRVGAAWLSDHVCFTSADGHYFHDLLPLPQTMEAVRHVAARIATIQDFLGEPLVVENVSAYAVAQEVEMSESEFLSALVAETGCRLLLDVNNLYVSEYNLGLSAQVAIDALPLGSVAEIHLGGYEDHGHFLVDAHNNPVSDAVWDLFERVARVLPEVPVLIEWDNDLPSLQVLLDEARKARAVLAG